MSATPEDSASAAGGPTDARSVDRRLVLRATPTFAHTPGVRRLRSEGAAGYAALLERGQRLAGGRADHRRLDGPEWTAPLRLRTARHGGALGRWLGERYVGPGRALREFETWSRLADAGIPTPGLAFVVAVRRGLAWRTALATVDRPAAIDGLALLESAPDAATLNAAAAAAGRTLRRLHDAGWRHGDLQLRNLLFERDAEGDLRCLLVDFDRATHRRSLSPRQRLAEWLRLARSLEKRGVAGAVGPAPRRRALAAYSEGDPALRGVLRARAPRTGRAGLRHRLAWRIAEPIRRGKNALALALGALGAATSALGPGLAMIGLGVGLGGCERNEDAAFAPPAETRRSLLAVGDTGRRRPFPTFFEGQLAVSRAMTRVADAAPVDGLVLLGDNFYWDGLDRASLVERLRENVVGPYCAFLALDGPRSSEVADACPPDRRPARGLPIYAVLGNHDLERDESPRLQREVVPAFVPGWRMSPGLADTVELGDGLSLVLFESEPAIDDREAIGAALGDAIGRAAGPWILLATHRPIATDDHGRPRLGGYPSFVRDAIAAAGRPVQLVLAAHHHTLQAFAVGQPIPSLQLGLGSGARAEPPQASADHPDLRFTRLALGFARIDLVGRGSDERLVATLYEAPPWPLLSSWVPPRAVARFAVDRAGRVEPLEPDGSDPSAPRQR